MELLASVNGKVTPVGEATVPVTDEGLIRGDGAFEFIKVQDGTLYTFSEHLDRLENSCAALDLPCPRAEIEADVAAVLEKSGIRDGAIRIMLTRGGNRIVLNEVVEPHPECARLKTVTFGPSVVLNGVKSLSYAANMAAGRKAKAAGFDEALLINPHGKVLEAPTSSIFWSDDSGALKTPSLELGILASITRQTLIDGLESVEEGNFALDEVLGASEVFLASTTRDVQPVAAIDDAEFAWPGPLTVEAQKVMQKAVLTASA